MKSFIFTIVALLFASTAYAVNVRGRIDYFAPQGVFPMSKASVQLCQGRSCLPQYITGGDGMYYFNANPGPHDVVVNGRVVYQIMVPAAPYFDVPALRGN